ncbi:hypothetical protein C8Q77DRAFT_1158553 [Trametes polyzona]|nr:hypothetical protein C8Q77DRAFT_1158553 [Trametes polyzona]
MEQANPAFVGPPSPPALSLHSAAIPPLDGRYGCLLIAAYISLCLYGVNVYQTSWYLHRYYHQDCRTVKSFVFITFLTDTLLTVVTVHACYHYLVLNYFNPQALGQGVWSFDALALLTGLTICIAQCFFARRVYKLRPKLYPLVIISMLFTSTSLAFAISAWITLGTNELPKPPLFTFTVGAIRLSAESSLTNIRPYTISDSIGLGVASIADTLTTSVLIVELKRIRTGWRQTDQLIDRLILYSFHTGLLTVMFNFLGLAFSVAYPEQTIGCAISIVNTKLYSNSLMVMLNARDSLSEDDRACTSEAVAYRETVNTFSTSGRAEQPPDVLWIRRMSNLGSGFRPALVRKPDSSPVNAA